ncbi:D-alanyl-D-alanine carboxypeptidase [Patescibacteria group bacterium]|nr:D-alanyl-D-alanine carboxypeptidase [Patescibacteria group bacterium]
MRKLFSLSTLITIILLGIVFYFKLYDNQKILIHSPLPDFLSISKNSQASTLNLWLPEISEEVGRDANLEITGRSVLVYDLTSKKTLYANNPKAKLPLASLTKIMTAVIALENPKADDRYLVRKHDLVGEDSMGVDAGEILSLKELLYGLIMHSGNDAAEVIASNYKDGRSSFIVAMNNKAKSLGLKDTNFTNPSGLEGDGDQYTTAYDLLIMTNYALNNFPLFREIAETPFYTIPKTRTHKEFVIENETNLLTSYPGVKGVKTGYTGEAGYCLITYLENEDHKIIAILLNSENRRDEMKILLDYSLLQQGITPPVHD